MMVNKKNHPDRTNMLKAIRAGKSTYAAHVKSCESCRTTYDFLNQIHNQSDFELEHPSPEALARYCRIPGLEESLSAAKAVQGILIADSWSGPIPIDVRDVTFGHVRRIRLEAGKIALEFVAERRETDWTFVARVYDGGTVSSDYILSIGRRKLLSKSQGFYFWDSKRPPVKISLLGDNSVIEFEQLRWS